MGYRSDVAVCMATKDFDKLYEKAKNQEKGEIQGAVDILAEGELTYVGVKKDIVVWQYSGIKWYWEYPEIAWLDDCFEDLNCLFIRIGESETDVEYFDYGECERFFDILQVCRSFKIVQ